MKFDQDFAEHGVEVSHHFAKGVYAKETRIPAGVVLKQHRHAYDHLSILAQGNVVVQCGKVSATHSAPDCILIRAGHEHSVRAVTDAVWYCVNSSEETEPAKADRSLVEDPAT